MFVYMVPDVFQPKRLVAELVIHAIAITALMPSNDTLANSVNIPVPISVPVMDNLVWGKPILHFVSTT